jgi:hypothetical protein
MTATAFGKTKAFIDQVHDLYLAQKKRGTIAPGVYRGTSPSIAADAENLFGCYIKNEFFSGSCYEIWVDPQISCPPNTKKKKRWIYKPDICVVRDNTVIGVFELKMDLGYLKKTFTAHAGERAALLRKASKAEVHCNIGGKRRDIRFAQDLFPNFVVFCRSNISQKQMETIEEYFKAKKSPGRALPCWRPCAY